MNISNGFEFSPLAIGGTPDSNNTKKKRRQENPPDRMRREMDKFRRMVRPAYSIDDLDMMMSEAERWFYRVDRRQRVAAQKRLNAMIRACDFSSGDSVADVVAMTRGADDASIRAYQLATVDIALECYEDFMRIVPSTAFHQEKLIDQFYWCSWWASIWQELMREHGDQSPYFFI